MCCDSFAILDSLSALTRFSCPLLGLAAINKYRTMRKMNDWELLQDYVKTHSEAAFAELVRCHIDWIYSAALRRVGNPQLAEDIVQSVFALLARKARSLRRGTVLGYGSSAQRVLWPSAPCALNYGVRAAKTLPLL